MPARLFGIGPSSVPKIFSCVEKSRGQLVSRAFAKSIAASSFAASIPTSAGALCAHAPAGGKYVACAACAGCLAGVACAPGLACPSARERPHTNERLKTIRFEIIGYSRHIVKTAASVVIPRKKCPIRTFSFSPC